jgi:competence protein ComEC
MRRRILVATLAVLLVIPAVAVAAAVAPYGTYQGFPIVKVRVNGIFLSPPVPGVNFYGSTMLPARAVAEALGTTVSWDAVNWVASIEAPDVATLRRELAQAQTDLTIAREQLAAVIGTPGDPRTYTFFSRNVVGTINPGSAAQGVVSTFGSSGGLMVGSLGVLEVHYIDVGQGDAVLLDTPAGKHILIDAGPSSARIVDYLRGVGVTAIDAFIITSPRPDHIGGAKAVLESFPVRKLYEPGMAQASDIYRAFQYTALAQMQRGTLQYEAAATGCQITVDPAVLFTVLNPAGLVTHEDNDRNSLALEVTHGQISFLFTGDIPGEMEGGLVPAKHPACRILKVGRHGDATVTSQFFLDAVAPDVSIVSVGQGNPDGSPDPEVMRRLMTRTMVYTTERNGTIKVRSDGGRITVTPEKMIR